MLRTGVQSRFRNYGVRSCRYAVEYDGGNFCIYLKIVICSVYIIVYAWTLTFGAYKEPHIRGVNSRNKNYIDFMKFLQNTESHLPVNVLICDLIIYELQNAVILSRLYKTNSLRYPGAITVRTHRPILQTSYRPVTRKSFQYFI